MFETKVTRHSFFRGKMQYECFTEHAPLCVEENTHDLCNCTKTVVARPPGEPESVTQAITFAEDIGKYRLSLELATAIGPGREYDGRREDDNAVSFTARWPRAEGAPARRKLTTGPDIEEHAYFWFLCENQLKVEVTGTGDHDDIDCTLGEVCFGNDVDVSTFFNGHSPSRIVNLTEIAPDDVWLHACTIGAEAWAKLSDERGADRLRQLQRLAVRIRKDVAPHNVVDADVKEVRASADSSETSRWLATDCFQMIEKLLDGFQGSALRRDILRVDREAMDKMIALRDVP